MAKKSTTPEATPEPKPEKKPAKKKQPSEKQPANKKQTVDDRSTSWACIVYPESAADFRQKVESLFLEGFCSPLHTDKDEESQLEKKPHHHLLFKFPTKKSAKQVADVFKQFGGVGTERVNNFRAYARYLCHLDQPDKKRYDPADVLTFGSLDYLGLIESTSDRYRVVAEIMEFCELNPERVRWSFYRLLTIAREENEEWFRHLCDDCARVVSDYLKSGEWEAGREAREKDREEERKARQKKYKADEDLARLHYQQSVDRYRRECEREDARA